MLIEKALCHFLESTFVLSGIGFLKKILWSLGFKTNAGTSLVGQWLRCHAPNAGDPGSMPGQGTSSHMRQLKVHMPQRRPESLCATAKAQQSQLNTFK